MKRVVLAYDGGGETSIAIPWLGDADNGGRGAAEVVAMVLDVGRGAALVEVRERALALGAVRCHVIDAREEFARDYILPALHAGAFADGRSPQVATLQYPLIAKKLVDVARMEDADAIAVPAGRATDTETIEMLVRSLEPSREIIVPANHGMMSGDAVRGYARAHGVDLEANAAMPAVDANIWGRAITIDLDATPSLASPVPAYELTRSPEHAPDQSADLEIEFEAGTPVRVNGIDMSLVEMIESLETIGGSHGIGRVDLTTTGRDGRRYREISESPAAAILGTAWTALGLARMTGTARVRLFKGECSARETTGHAVARAATAQR
ncbi:MAG TPA: argininosuccinate synthase domain-containing protein [Vicinamibacterales bacterium]|nr:argininosuccinate synthase domain-containing protein [Vicinamibacterales bacterium]